uniref:MiaA_1 protein n=1 Tax=Fopius arisanus TaxID=64838 RepID=A0A0C9QBQ7_9HYME
MSDPNRRKKILQLERVQRHRNKQRTEKVNADSRNNIDDEWLGKSLFENTCSRGELNNARTRCPPVNDGGETLNIQNHSLIPGDSDSHSEFCDGELDEHGFSNGNFIELPSESNNGIENPELFSSDGESENSVWGDEDDEDELRPASVTEDDIDTLDEFSSENPETEQLREWARRHHKVTHTQLTELLLIFRQRLLPELPKCAKTFLGTTSARYDIQVDPKDNSEFVYFNLTEQLKRQANPQLHIDRIIYLVINVDGLQLYKSSSKQFWPILCSIYSEENFYKPFPVAIYSGTSKPKNLDKFLEKFVDELNGVQRDGLFINNQKYRVCIKCFVCDRPARAFLKCIKHHGAYWACERCNVRGIRVAGRTTYPLDVSSEERTDDSFREQSNPEHHTGQSPLLKITPKINMVTSFVLDFMHLLCLGVMKKLIGYWLHNKSTRLNFSAQALLSALLLQFQNQIPCEFQRTTRSLTEIERFKATEFKFILLYAGPVIFKKVLPEIMYKHFLLLHVSCRILCSKTKALAECANAKRLLVKFVSLMPRIYGPASLIGNIHNLVHLADDVYHMAVPLSTITAFPFESTLGKMKRLLRQGNRPLSQICRRLHETFVINSTRVIPPQLIQIERQLLPDRTGKVIVKRVKYREATLTDKFPNNAVLLENNNLLEITNMHIPPGMNEIYISGQLLKKKKSLLSFPCNSEALEMWVITRAESTVKSYRLNQVSKKMITLKVNHQGKHKIYIMPLLHM